jgi:Peptidase family M1 domain
MRLSIILLLLVQSFGMIAQNTYKTSARYWKNRKPHAGYWQQDVHYKINANIDEVNNLIDATEELTYTNNSPDALPFVYFHVYQNAFIKDSYLDELHKVNKIKTWFGKSLGAGLGTTISSVKINGVDCKTELDNTILKVYLPQPLASGANITFQLGFKTYWDYGAIRRRMQLFRSGDFYHYNGVHWYPRISVYDAKKGWDVDQHLNKELYGNFGTFDVSLNFPSNYFVEATGLLQNKQEVLPDDVWQKVQIKNFKDKPFGQAASTIIPYKSGERKTWKYHADFVHDFAFTADPSYRYEEQEVYGVKCVAIAMEQHASKWQTAASYVAKIIKTFSDDFGMYEYPKMVAADANDGMEYPMITLDGGAEPNFHGLFVHEIAHNWFYGMIGNNETYRAALDEGFTQFATGWGLQKIDGDTSMDSPDGRSYVRKHRKNLLVWDRTFLNRYTSDAMRGDDKALNTHSNDFHSGLAHENGYNSVYQKTASMLLNLQYTIGDTLFQGAMKHYVEKWKFAHPYFEDFRQSIIEYTHIDLNWFFDQWMETTKTIDYSVSRIKRKGKGNFLIELKRKGEMQMPIDVTIIAKNGIKYSYHIPNTNWFVKTTTATVLPKWYGWDLLHPTYSFTANVPSGIESVQIDTTYRLADANMTDNTVRKDLFGYTKPVSNAYTDWGLRNPASRRQYTKYYRPDLWWNPIDGVKVGLHVEGSYMNYIQKLNADLWWNTGLANRNYNYIGQSKRNPFDFLINYETPLSKIHKKLSVGFQLKNVEGLVKNQIFFNWNFSPSEMLHLEVTNLYRSYGPIYQNYTSEWSSYRNRRMDTAITNIGQAANAFVQMSYAKRYNTFTGNGRYSITMRASVPSFSKEINSYNAAYLQWEWMHNQPYKKFDIRTRLFTRFGFGNLIPTESALYLAGANPEEMSENKYTRTAFVNDAQYNQIQTAGNSNLHMGGGLNLRGYNGYLAVEDGANGALYQCYKGRSGASASAEIDFDRYIKFAPKFTRNWLKMDTYVFGDAGSISNGTIDIINVYNLIPDADNGWSAIRADAGLGAILTIKHFGRFEKANPLSLRIDWPIAVNRIPNNSTTDFISAKRWVIGVNRSF